MVKINQCDDILLIKKNIKNLQNDVNEISQSIGNKIKNLENKLDDGIKN